MTEWQCPDCYRWRSMNVLKCVHVSLRNPTVAEMVAARNAGHDESALNQAADTTVTVWQPHFERRTVPDECS